MKRRIWLFLAALAAAAPLHAAEPPLVDITAIVEHPALDAVRAGLKEGLAAAGYTEGQGVRYNFQSAQGQPATAAQIAKQFAGEAPAVIVAISTPSAQAAAAATHSIPVVFSAVTDPLAAQLVRDPANPGGNVTGVSDLAPVADEIALIKRLSPAAKTVGVVYNPGEPNSVSLVRRLKDLAPAAGLAVVEAPASKSADVAAAASSLAGRADAIYAPTDNTLASAFETLARTARAQHIPIYSADTDQVPLGALAAVGFNYHQVGVQTAGVVARILKGEAPGAIPVTFAEGNDLYLNRSVAATLGITLPDELLAKAAKVTP